MFDDLMPLGEASRILFEAFERGEKVCCPTCNRNIGKYEKTLSSAMASVMGFLYLRTKGDTTVWVHLNKTIPHESTKKERSALEARDWWALRHWGLISQRTGVGAEHVEYGTWRITDLGVQFVRGNLFVPKKLLTWGGVMYGYVAGSVTVNYKEALRNRRDWSLKVD